MRSVFVPRALHFVRADPRLLAFGLLLTLGSSFGQTWFIALFSGEIRAAFAIGNGEFGAIYSAGTLASAALLTWSGHWIDRLDLRRWTTIVIVLSALACVAMALVQDVWMLVVVVFLLRHLGQGLMGHTSVTSQGRYYDAARGRALATVALGGPLARATLPLAVVATLAAIGWRQSWIVFAAALGLALLPVCLWLLRDHDRRHDRYLSRAGDEAPQEGGPAGSAPAHWTRKAVLRDPRFYALLPIVLAPSFIGTGLIFHQVVLIEAKGWALETWAAAFIGHAAASVISGLALGAAIDRVGAARAAVAIAAAGLRLSLAERIGRHAGGLGLHDPRGHHVGNDHGLLRCLLAPRLRHPTPRRDPRAGLRVHGTGRGPGAGDHGRGVGSRGLDRGDHPRLCDLLRHR